jgi:hypothetical protein
MFEIPFFLHSPRLQLMQQQKNMKNSLRMLTANRIYSYKMVNVNVITPASGQKDYAHDMCHVEKKKSKFG